MEEAAFQKRKRKAYKRPGQWQPEGRGGQSFEKQSRHQIYRILIKLLFLFTRAVVLGFGRCYFLTAYLTSQVTLLAPLVLTILFPSRFQCLLHI